MNLVERKKVVMNSMFGVKPVETKNVVETGDIGVDYISDIHLDSNVKIDFNTKKWEEGTRSFVRGLINEERSSLLIVDGDVSNSTKQIVWAFDELTKYYDEILYVFGNHEYYMDSGNSKKKYNNKSTNKVKEIHELLKDYTGIKVCSEMKTYDYKGKTIVAGTLWYPIETQEQKDYYKKVSNDSANIHFIDIAMENKRAEGVLKSVSNIDLVVTHMPPYATESIIANGEVGCYNGEVNLYDIDTVNWIYGHTHENREYVKEIGNREINMYTNARGYKSDKKDVKIKTLII